MIRAALRWLKNQNQSNCRANHKGKQPFWANQKFCENSKLLYESHRWEKAKPAMKITWKWNGVTQTKTNTTLSFTSQLDLLVKPTAIDHFHKWWRILLLLCIYVNKTYWPHFGWNILLNLAHGSEVRKAYLH